MAAIPLQMVMIALVLVCWTGIHATSTPVPENGSPVQRGNQGTQEGNNATNPGIVNQPAADATTNLTVANNGKGNPKEMTGLNMTSTSPTPSVTPEGNAVRNQSGVLPPKTPSPSTTVTQRQESPTQTPSTPVSDEKSSTASTTVTVGSSSTMPSTSSSTVPSTTPTTTIQTTTIPSSSSTTVTTILQSSPTVAVTPTTTESTTISSTSTVAVTPTTTQSTTLTASTTTEQRPTPTSSPSTSMPLSTSPTVPMSTPTTNIQVNASKPDVVDVKTNDTMPPSTTTTKYVTETATAANASVLIPRAQKTPSTSAAPSTTSSTTESTTMMPSTSISTMPLSSTTEEAVEAQATPGPETTLKTKTNVTTLLTSTAKPTVTVNDTTVPKVIIDTQSTTTLSTTTLPSSSTSLPTITSTIPSTSTSLPTITSTIPSSSTSLPTSTIALSSPTSTSTIQSTSTQSTPTTSMTTKDATPIIDISAIAGSSTTESTTTGSKGTPAFTPAITKMSTSPTAMRSTPFEAQRTSEMGPIMRTTEGLPTSPVYRPPTTGMQTPVRGTTTFLPAIITTDTAKMPIRTDPVLVSARTTEGAPVRISTTGWPTTSTESVPMRTSPPVQFTSAVVVETSRMTTMAETRAPTTRPVDRTTRPRITSPPVVSTTETTTRMTSTLAVETTPGITKRITTSEAPVNQYYTIMFEGDCNLIQNDVGFREKFESEVVSFFVKKVNVPKDSVLIQDISCGSVNVTVELEGVVRSRVNTRLTDITRNPVPITVEHENTQHTFLPVGYEAVDQIPSGGGAKPSTAKGGLSKMDLTIITVVALVGLLLIVTVIALLAHECRKRHHTKSFDLRGTPRPNAYSEDFTLTKMERGQPEYNDYGPVISTPVTNGRSNYNTGTKLAPVPETVVQNGSAEAHYEVEVEGDPESPNMSLMKSVRTPANTGIENPSFSSEDMLDSGTETDRENLSTDGILNHHGTTDTSPPGSDSGRQSGSTTEIHSPELESPASSSPPLIEPHTDDGYEPVQIGVDTGSHSSREAMLPSNNEVTYPASSQDAQDNEDSSDRVASSAVSSPTYEMVETLPGSRSSDYIMPASEGATAF